MTELYLAFKHGLMFVDPLSRWLPAFLNIETVLHVEMILKKNCYGASCQLCKQSLSRVRNRRHFVSYYVNVGTVWQMKIDDPKFHQQSRRQWIFVVIPMISSLRCWLFLDRQMDKPMNVAGILSLSVGIRAGCTLQTLHPIQQTSWFCSELFAAVLRDQGYVNYFTLDPCITRPLDLLEQSLTIPGAYQTTQHPSYLH